MFSVRAFIGLSLLCFCAWHSLSSTSPFKLIQAGIYLLQTCHENAKNLGDSLLQIMNELANLVVFQDAKGSLASRALNEFDLDSVHFDFLDFERCLVAVWAVRHIPVPSGIGEYENRSSRYVSQTNLDDRRQLLRITSLVIRVGTIRLFAVFAIDPLNFKLMATLLECRVDVGARNARSPFNCGARTDHGAGISIFNFDQAYGFPFAVGQFLE
jgi:hypothetical protein